MRSGGISKERKLMKATLSVIAFGSQVRHTDSDHSDPQTKCNCDFLTRADRRLLLGASLRLLAVKFSHGRPILQNDVLRLAPLADDVERTHRRGSAEEERLEAPVPLRLPEVHRAPGEFDELPDELPDPSVGWTKNPERSRG